MGKSHSKAKTAEVKASPHPKSPFAKYRGIGTPGISGGKKGINKWLRDLRGK
jgi:hypothetical protein